LHRPEGRRRQGLGEGGLKPPGEGGNGDPDVGRHELLILSVLQNRPSARFSARLAPSATVAFSVTSKKVSPEKNSYRAPFTPAEEDPVEPVGKPARLAAGKLRLARGNRR